MSCRHPSVATNTNHDCTYDLIKNDIPSAMAKVGMSSFVNNLNPSLPSLEPSPLPPSSSDPLPPASGTTNNLLTKNTRKLRKCHWKLVSDQRSLAQLSWGHTIIFPWENFFRKWERCMLSPAHCIILICAPEADTLHLLLRMQQIVWTCRDLGRKYAPAELRSLPETPVSESWTLSALHCHLHLLDDFRHLL